VSHTWAKKNILGMSDNDVILDLQQQRLERALGAELGITQNIIKRTGVFDEVDKKYGIPEEERQAMEDNMAPAEGDDMGGMDLGSGGGSAPPPPPDSAGDEPLSETKKSKILGMLGDDTKEFDDLFDVDKAQQNIYEIENKLKDIIQE
jgi:hypothetical protein